MALKIWLGDKLVSAQDGHILHGQIIQHLLLVEFDNALVCLCYEKSRGQRDGGHAFGEQGVHQQGGQFRARGMDLRVSQPLRISAHALANAVFEHQRMARNGSRRS